MYGFLINDFFDMPYDIVAGKRRAVHELPKIAFIGVILAVVFISALHLLYLKELHYIATYVVSYILATLYSAPPMRFKSGGFTGLVVNGFIEKMLPVLAVFSFFNHFRLDTFIFLLTAFFVQIAEAMTHQINDYENDLGTGIRSSVVIMGREKALKIFNKFIIPFSMMHVILLFSLIFIKVIYVIFIGIAVLMVYAVMSLLIREGRLTREEKVFPLYMSSLYFLLNNALPPFLAFVLSIEHALNTALLLVAIGSQYYMLKYFLKLLREKVISRTEIVDT